MALHAAIHVGLVLLMPPLLLGVIGRTKARFAGRRGPPLLQPYRDLAKLVQKGMVISTAVSPAFLVGPALTLAATLFAALLVPLGHHEAVVAFSGDMLLLAGLLALGRFATTTAALDTGSPFEGMGAAREATFAWLAEPALLLGFVALARTSGSSSLSGMLADPAHPPLAHIGPMLLVVAGWFLVLLVENCRIPFDDPNTHLELTMIHEVMVLDHSGPALALIHLGAAVKLFLFAGLMLGVAIPFTGDPWLDWLVFAGAAVALAALVGIVESVMARLRLVHVPKLLVSASLLTAFALVFLLER